MTFNDTEEYSLRSIAILGCKIYSQITVAHVTLPKAVHSKLRTIYPKKTVPCQILKQALPWGLRRSGKMKKGHVPQRNEDLWAKSHFSLKKAIFNPEDSHLF